MLFQTNSFSGAVADQPETGSGAMAAVKEINKSGGVNGHLLKLDQCDNQVTPNLTNTCVAQAGTDKAAAFVGSGVFFPAAWPIIQKEGIPYLLGEGLTPAEDTDSVSFPLAGQPGWYYGISAYLKELGATHPALIRCEISACAYGGTLLYSAFKQMGITPVRTVIAPLATTDYTSFAAEAIQGDVNAAIITGTEATAVPEAIALRQQGFKGKIIGVSADISQNALPSLGSAAAGLYVIGQVKQPTTSNSTITQFKADMTAYAPQAKQDELALVAWASVKLFAQVAVHLKTVDASTVLKALQTAKVGTYKTGVTAALPAATTSPLKGYPRLGFDPTVTYNQVQNGVIQQTTSGYPNPFIVHAG